MKCYAPVLLICLGYASAWADSPADDSNSIASGTSSSAVVDESVDVVSVSSTSTSDLQGTAGESGSSDVADGVTSDGAAADEGLAAGHSRHGEVFNEGPRQQAYLRGGTGKISFEVTSEDPLVQKFIEQGIGQLHGFWYFESERSFRQAAMLDPDCAMAYWGMAGSNVNNEERATGFIERAMELRESASKREQLYIESLHAYLTSDKKKKEREADYIHAVEALIDEYPDDLEAKALLGYLLYKYRGSVDRSHAEVDVVLDSILAKEKDHPVHHYRIHLWDHKSPQRALDSAAKCGPAADGIAHMWHMCGHIFSRVKRYGDAAWFQEASARVDHRHMMHDRVLPDQIHNFAHNNEWLIRNLMHVGRRREALALAKNMIELPRHPKYNVLSKRASTAYGRDRLMNVLERYELWEEAVALANSEYLEPTDEADEQMKRLRLLGKAQAHLGNIDAALAIVADFEERLAELKTQEPTMADVEAEMQKEEQERAETDGDDAADDEEDEQDDKDKKEKDPQKEREKRLKNKQEDHKSKVERIEQDIATVSGYVAWHRGEFGEAISLLDKAEEDKMSIARIRVLHGDAELAVKDARKYAKDRKNQVVALAGLVEVLWNAGKVSDARAAFIDLRANSNWLETDSRGFDRLAPIAQELGFPADWRVQMPPADDLGEQPPLDSLGPFRWRPAPAPDWVLPESNGAMRSLRDYRGRPVIMVFYLGYGCLHCAEQIQAIAPMVSKFEEAGISLIAVSSDNLEGLELSQENYDGERIPFPLVANPEHDIFKAYRAFDDFEDLPLHGTFLIDGKGNVRWQDISYDPFMDIDFLLAESKRLLAQDESNASKVQELADR